MENTTTIDALNDLLQITNDRIEGFENAGKKVLSFNPKLSGEFQQMAIQSQQMRTDLVSLISERGGNPNNTTSLAGGLHRTWMDVKNTFSADNDEATLENVTFGENAAINAYEDALKSGDLCPDSAKVVQDQLTILKSSYLKFKNLEELEN